MQLRGKVAKKYPDDINTDYIIPAYLLQESWDKQFFADHAFEYYDPSFKSTCRPTRRASSWLETTSGAGARGSRPSTR
jgi:3-isopropylmalate dehydratase small subunit